MIDTNPFQKFGHLNLSCTGLTGAECIKPLLDIITTANALNLKSTTVILYKKPQNLLVYQG